MPLNGGISVKLKEADALDVCVRLLLHVKLAVEICCIARAVVAINKFKCIRPKAIKRIKLYARLAQSQQR